MTILQQRLAELADLGAPARDAQDHFGEPSAAWRRGLRYRRRRRIGTALIGLVAVALLIALGGTWAVRADTTIAPAGSTAPAGLPDRFHSPSPWLAGTDDEGPLGRLAVLLPAERKGWGGSRGLQPLGISATTGEYRFLDLPDRAQGGELSPDGRLVAYWATGEPSGTPNTAGGQDLVVTGIAVYDVTTGTTERADIPTEHGLAVGGLVWADGDTVLVRYGQHLGGDDDPERSSISNDYTWEVRSADLTLVTSLDEKLSVDGAAHGRVLTDRAVLDPRTGATVPIGYRAPLMYVTSLDPTGTRVALPGRPGPNNRTPAQLEITATDGSTFFVPDSGGTFETWGWSDRDHVAVLTESETREGPWSSRDLRIDLVDVRDGTRETLIETHGVSDNTFQLATDLIGEPTVAAVEPPSPLDPRWVTGGAVAIILAAGIALLRWRRRVAP